MTTRRRRDGQPTASEAQRQCEHLPSEGDAGLCAKCGVTLVPDGDDVEDLASTLPPSDVAPPAGASVEERQADAVADSAPPVGGDPAAEGGDNSKSRYEIIKDKFARLGAIKAEQKVLRDEAAEIVEELEKQQGVNRGGLSEVRRLFGLDAATIKVREESRRELFELLIKPKLDEAETGQADE